MNNARRKRIDAVAVKLSELRDELDEITAEEQDYFDNMPEGFQNGSRGDNAQTCIETLEEVASDVSAAYDTLSGMLS